MSVLFFFKQTCANANNFTVRCREFPPFPDICLPTERWLTESCLNTTLQLHTYDLELIPNPAAYLLVLPDCTHPDPEAGIDPCPYSTRSCPHPPASIKTSCSGLIIIFCGQLAPGWMERGCLSCGHPPRPLNRGCHPVGVLPGHRLAQSLTNPHGNTENQTYAAAWALTWGRVTLKAASKKVSKDTSEALLLCAPHLM